MPAGKPNAQTRATAKYQEKIGLIVKSFKIKKDLADNFKKACEASGESQAEVITRFMLEYIDSHKNN